MITESMAQILEDKVLTVCWRAHSNDWTYNLQCNYETGLFSDMCDIQREDSYRSFAVLNTFRDLPEVLHFTVLIEVGSFWPWIMETGSLIETTLLCWLPPAENLSLQDVLQPHIMRGKKCTSKSNQGGGTAMGLSPASSLRNSADRCPAGALLR